MNFRLVVPMVAVAVFAAALPAAACDGNSKTAMASSAGHCGGISKTAWAGAWLQRAPGGELTVAAVAKGSAAERSGLRKGDVVLAVNGRDLSAQSSGHCADGSVCAIGSSFAYTIQRGKSTKVVKVKLEKMRTEDTTRFADLNPSYEPTLAAMVIPIVD